ncbi:uncharacterized protein MCYG_01865 [Microsporum canis CBS 113480]|uniref:Uncharacterized protein n=1 Tax=Arthroderma otae (strain ATCC MYA-4605 / CBS 113480) TaxID=554155 RepID=C5FI66_ARTOC|nr:uncharacterized protein MCYG_01865 [Microsporum canis CBS 113480]EEQ29046.1 hypothetical protein MCYG_01865 [Microsporum canis CBS 113480]
MSQPTVMLRTSLRRFSAQAPKPESRAQRYLAASCIVSGVLLPFIPPALESSRGRKLDQPPTNKYPPLCFHAR